MSLVIPDRSVGHTTDQMPGIEKIVFVKAQGQWLARVFPEPGGGIASGAGFGENIAQGLYFAIIEHNQRQG